MACQTRSTRCGGDLPVVGADGGLAAHRRQPDSLWPSRGTSDKCRKSAKASLRRGRWERRDAAGRLRFVTLSQNLPSESYTGPSAILYYEVKVTTGGYRLKRNERKGARIDGRNPKWRQIHKRIGHLCDRGHRRTCRLTSIIDAQQFTNKVHCRRAVPGHNTRTAKRRPFSPGHRVVAERPATDAIQTALLHGPLGTTR